MMAKSVKILRDYENQKRMGLDPIFIPEDLGFDNCELWDEIVDEKYADLKAAKKAAENKAQVGSSPDLVA
jgi:AGCS family alanine or glycine:cation symporter